MSSDAAPITFERFARALEDLNVGSLYSKYAELTNQIAHLESSNKQLEEFARENDDRDCYEALLENKLVMKRFEERKELIKKEVQDVRGLPWRPQGEETTAPAPNGTATATTNGSTAAQEGGNDTDTRNGEDDAGVYL
ncbi:hypothetical protein ACN47E_005149 [Coniothyrium glycines]